MGADACSPAKVADSIVDASAAGVTLRLQSVPGNCAQGCGGVAGAHEDGVRGMAIVEDAGTRSGLVSANTVSRWSG